MTASAVIDHVVISPATAAVTAGTSQSYSAQGYDSADNPIGDVTTSTTFSIGVDGSAAGSTGQGGCTRYFWRNVLH